METWIVIGAVVVAVAPRVPGLRDVAKTAVKTGMTIGNKGRDAAVTAGEHWADLVAEANSGPDESSNGSAHGVAVPVTFDAESAA